MSKQLAEILGLPASSFFIQIEELERLSHRPGMDIRLSTELKHLFKDKARLVGLDENDTTGHELYYAASKLAMKQSDELAKTIGISDDDSPKKMVEQSIKFVQKRIGKKNIWALKPAAARKQLKDNPPKRLMKIWGIRSIDSALKRERISSLYAFAKLTEPPGWFAKYSQQANKLKNSDFDNQALTISILSENRQNQLAKAGIKLNQVIYFDQESAGLEICPPAKRFKGDVLFVVDHLLQQIRHMLRRSAYLKVQGFRPNFFAKVSRTRLTGFSSAESENYPFDWPTVVYAATELGVKGLLQDEEPFVSAEELLVPSLPQIMGLEFWKHPFALCQENNILLPLNLSDMIINAANSTAPEKAYVENAKNNLKNELFARYLDILQQRQLLNMDKYLYG